MTDISSIFQSLYAYIVMLWGRLMDTPPIIQFCIFFPLVALVLGVLFRSVRGGSDSTRL